MFGDFEISSTGDLLFREQAVENVSLKLKFSLTKTNACRISFDLEEFSISTPSVDALKVSFDIKRKTSNMTASVVRGSSATGQLTSLKMKTTIGDLPRRSDFGSMLAKMAHKEINDTNLRMIEKYVEECISDIVLNPTVVATPNISFSNGYMQEVKVVIYDNSKVIATYILER